MTQLAEYRSLLRLGASPDEAVAVLAAVVELSADMWRNEMRGPDGRWAKAAGSAAKAVTHEDLEQHHLRAVTVATAQARSETAKALAEQNAAHKAEMRKMMAQVRSANSHLREMQEKEERKKSRVKLASHIGFLTAGAVLAAIEAKMGVNVIAMAATGLGPGVVMELIDAAKKL